MLAIGVIIREDAIQNTPMIGLFFIPRLMSEPKVFPPVIAPNTKMRIMVKSNATVIDAYVPYLFAFFQYNP